MGEGRPGVRGTRTVRRLLGVGAALALVGPLSSVARPDVAAAAPTGYVTMSDGVSIAVNVRMPTNYVPGSRYPTVFEMSGYDGGSANGGTLAKDVGVPPGTPVPVDDSRQLTDYLNGDYVTVHASVRGTGCSSGEFDLFSWRSALDGKEIIDNWIPNQPWSNGDVGILGHSYGGITGFMVAATQRQHLKAATVSGLIDDLYRGIVYPGGVSNYGFPLIWTGGIRTAYDVGGGLLPGLVRPQRPGDSPNRQEQCALNTAGKSRTVTNDPLLQGLSDTDNDWYRSRSLITYVDKIKVPIHITGAYQDEQPGPRGQTHLFERIGGVPKRLILSNGNHDTESTADYGVPDIRNDRKAWLDQWVRGVNGGVGDLKQARSSVSVLFETHKETQTDPETQTPKEMVVPNGRQDANTFPPPHTTWTDPYLHGDRPPDGRISRPSRPHTTPTNFTPGQTYEYLVEVWPVGHVFRAGHRVSVKVHAPPFVDSFYAYVPRSAPGVNTVLQGPDTPSRNMLPMVPLTGVQLGPPLPCGAQEAVRCVAQPG